MSFVAPAFLLAGGAVVLGVAALHFLARRRPLDQSFPTARFIAERAAQAPAPARRPSDLMVLMVRALGIVLLATAFAQPLSRRHAGIRRVILADVSRVVDSSARVIAEAGRLQRAGDVVIAFDTAAQVMEPLSAAPGAQARTAPGSLSTALIAAIRAAATLKDGDSIELIVISPLAREEWDGATAALRALWPGRIRLVRGAAAVPPPRAGVDVRSAPDDPVLAAARLAGLIKPGTGPRAAILRSASAPEDSVAVRERGTALVHWPTDLERAGWPSGPNDTIGGLVSGDVVIVASFPRPVLPPPGRVIARWADGVPAATERDAGAGCIRDVAVPIPWTGDLALGLGVRRLVGALTRPCGAPELRGLLEDSLVRGAGPLAPRAAFPTQAPRRVPANGWLLVAAFLVIAVEPAVRWAGRA